VALRPPESLGAIGCSLKARAFDGVRLEADHVDGERDRLEGTVKSVTRADVKSNDGKVPARAMERRPCE
jgi:hypothetical protein